MTKIRKLEATPISAEHVIRSGEMTSTFNTVPVVHCPPSDPTRGQEMKMVEESGLLDFWNRPEEEGYTEYDGEPL